MQQSPFARLSMDQPSTPSSFINAPTSLTNLAQLSGISLVPVNERPQPSFNTSSNNNQIISFNGHQLSKIAVGANSRQHLPATIHDGFPAANTYAQFPTVYNLETIPSIQLLNRVTADQQRDTRGQATVSQITNAAKSKRQVVNSNLSIPNNLPGNKKPRSQAHPTALPCAGNRTQIDVNSISNTARGPQSPINNPLHTSRPPPLTTHGNDNMSLLKLMAIFNNPALTITPVGPVSTASSANPDVNLWANLSQKDQKNSKPNFINDLRSPHNSPARNTSKSTSETSQINQLATKISDNKKNVTKSKSNLQIIYTGSARTSTDAQDCIISTEEPRLQSTKQEKAICEEPHTITLSWSARNTIPDNPSDGPSSAIRDPTRMLKEFVDAAEKNESWSSEQLMDAPNLGPDCIMTERKFNLKPLDNEAKCKNLIYSVFSKEGVNKLPKGPIVSTKRRLYVPRVDGTQAKKAKFTSHLNDIEIATTEQPEETYVSERHLVLNKMGEIAEAISQKRTTTVEPDDIFVDRSKRIMSRIDNDVERKRKKNFEKISQRSPKVEDQDNSSDESEYEIQMVERQSKINELTVLPVQLPLEEAPDEQKREFLSSVGLVSRADKNKMMVKQSEERLRIFSSLNGYDGFDDVNGDVRRIVDTLIQTGGGDVSMRTETDIKRNELPFIEGLNRNTSKVKMTFMNALGLEKRSKRTTLYKVVKPHDVAASNIQEQKAHDLSSKVKNLIFDKVVNLTQVVAEAAPKVALPVTPAPPVIPVEPAKQNGTEPMHASSGGADILRKAIRLAQASCREALHQAPNKDEYMKSLGLMAS